MLLILCRSSFDDQFEHYVYCINLQGDEKEFYKFRLGYHEVRNWSVRLFVWHSEF